MPESKQFLKLLIARGRTLRRAALGFLVASAVAVAALLPQTGDAAATQATVATTTGTFTSVASSTNADVSVFFGIRYAAAPEGNLRWTPPTAPTPPSGTVTASTPGDACPSDIPTTPINQSEDCLFLNVWTPAGVSPTAKLPVFFWIHGGALTFGTGATYNPSTMVADSNIIVVTINYRLGALGWLVEPGLVTSSASTFQNVGDAGDYGLMDQEFALQWVQSNIAAFGGDPTKVTVGGESAGGLSVTSILTSTNTASGLFRAAIIESGSYMLQDVPSQSTYESEFGATFDKDVGCTPPEDAACLRGKSVEEILTAQEEAFGTAGISPDFSTKILPNSLASALSAGEFFQVPVLQGTNANEGRLFEPLIFEVESPNLDTTAVDDAGGPANFDLANANSFCAVDGKDQKCTFTQEINLFLKLLGISSTTNSSSFDATIASDYALANFPDPFLAKDAPSSDEALSQIFTDLFFSCNAFDSNTFLSQFVTVYAYEFNDPLAPPSEGSDTAIEAPNDVDGFPTASEHASELPFLFVETGTTFNLSANEQTLASEMTTYWGNFVVNSNPNSSAEATWPTFNSSGNPLQDLVPGPASPSPFTTFQTEHFCSTWAPLIAVQTGE